MRHHGGGAGGGRIDVVLEVEAVRGPHAIDTVHDAVDAAARAAVPPGPGRVPTKHHIHDWLFETCHFLSQTSLIHFFAFLIFRPSAL